MLDLIGALVIIGLAGAGFKFATQVVGDSARHLVRQLGSTPTTRARSAHYGRVLPPPCFRQMASRRYNWSSRKGDEGLAMLEVPTTLRWAAASGRKLAKRQVLPTELKPAPAPRKAKPTIKVVTAAHAQPVTF